MDDPRWLERIITPNPWIAEAIKPQKLSTGKWLVAYETFIKIPDQPLDSVYVHDMFTYVGTTKTSVWLCKEIGKEVFKATYEYWNNSKKYDIDVAGVFGIVGSHWPASVCAALLVKLIQEINFEPVTMGVRFKTTTNYQYNRLGTYILWAASKDDGIMLEKDLPKSVETTQNGNSVLLRFGKLKTVKVIKVGDGFGLVCKNKLLVPTEYGITESQLLCSKDIKANRKKE